MLIWYLLLLCSTSRTLLLLCSTRNTPPLLCSTSSALLPLYEVLFTRNSRIITPATDETNAACKPVSKHQVPGTWCIITSVCICGELVDSQLLLSAFIMISMLLLLFCWCYCWRNVVVFLFFLPYCVVSPTAPRPASVHTLLSCLLSYK